MSDKIQSVRSSVVRSLCIAAACGPEPTAFYGRYKKVATKEKVPRTTQIEVARYYSDLVRAKGIEMDDADLDDDEMNAEPELPVSDAKLVADVQNGTSDYVDDDGFGEEVSPEGSPLTEAVRQETAKWQVPKRFKFLCQLFHFNGEPFYLISSWRLRNKEGYEWNLTGTTGNHPVLHKCGPDVLHFENDNAICINDDFEVEWEIPKRFSDSKLAGTKQVVEATLFVWVVKFVPNREFRFWLNEKRPSPSKDVKPKEDIWTTRKVMKLADA